MPADLDLDLDLFALARPGRKAADFRAETARELAPADFALLSTRSVQPAEIKRLTERHHMVARALASGLKPGEVAIATGYDGARISILQNSPAFRELVAFYSDAKDQVFAETMGQLAGLAKDAVIELRDRLEEKPEDFTNGMLLDISTKMLDRSGHGPTSTSQSLNVNVTLGSRLEAARQRARDLAHGLIDISPEGSAA